MLRRLTTLVALALIGLSLSGFSSPLAPAAEGEGNPWWLWIVVLFVLAAFAAFALWYWMRSQDEEEEEEAIPYTRPAHVVVQDKVEPVQPDDLKRVEGIGPKIAGVLQAAGIATFAQLADTDVEQLKQILGQADPNLLRLADPASWPQQARLAADGAWEELAKLQDELKGGRRV